MGAFNFELLEAEGVPTHYRGVVENGDVVDLEDATHPPWEMAIDLTQVPDLPNEGREYDYERYHDAAGENYLIPSRSSSATGSPSARACAIGPSPPITASRSIAGPTGCRPRRSDRRVHHEVRGGRPPPRARGSRFDRRDGVDRGPRVARPRGQSDRHRAGRLRRTGPRGRQDRVSLLSGRDPRRRRRRHLRREPL